MDPKKITDEVLDVLDELEYKDCLLVIANVLIELGLEGMRDLPTDLSSTPKLADAIIQHRKKHGETPHNAMATQGLTMLVWLSEEKT